MSAHTPWPWIVETRAAHPNHAGSFSVTAANDGVVICGRMGWPSNVEESHANARLIGAAPEMYQALRDAVAALGGIRSDHVPESVRAALAKADGR